MLLYGLPVVQLSGQAQGQDVSSHMEPGGPAQSTSVPRIHNILVALLAACLRIQLWQHPRTKFVRQLLLAY